MYYYLLYRSTARGSVGPDNEALRPSSGSTAAILMSVYHPPGWQGWIGTVFAVGFLLAAGLGAYVAWGIIRSR
jgi:hypothetical protein